MRKYLGIAVTLAVIVSLVFVPGVSAGPPPADWTDTPEYDQIKVAQVPLPWQFWAYAINTDGTVTIIDRIRISPTWETPPIEPPGLPPGEGTILVRRWVTLTDEAIPLEALQWGFSDVGGQMEPDPAPPPLPGVGVDDWIPIEIVAMELVAGQDLVLPITIPAGSEARAVLVAYEVLRERGGVQVVEGHFLNEAVLELPSPDIVLEQAVSPIVEVRVNFDIHNDTDYAVTNFELDFQGLEFSGDNITGAVGFKVGGGPWGANPQNPLIVRPIEIKVEDPSDPDNPKTIKGTEVKWVEPCDPLVKSDWLHIGLSFTLPEWIESVDATVQGYWTQLRPKVWCEEAENPHGKTVPPAGWSTLPGRKGGQNEDGFYQLFYRIPPCWPTPDDPVDPKSVSIWVGTNDLGPLFGGYDNKVVVKITEAPGAIPTEKKIGSQTGKAGAVKSHITLPSDPVLFLVDVDGNVIARCGKCLVPPPPK